MNAPLSMIYNLNVRRTGYSCISYLDIPSSCSIQAEYGSIVGGGHGDSKASGTATTIPVSSDDPIVSVMVNADSDNVNCIKFTTLQGLSSQCSDHGCDNPNFDSTSSGAVSTVHIGPCSRGRDQYAYASLVKLRWICLKPRSHEYIYGYIFCRICIW